MTEALKLIAREADDIKVLSAILQDAVMTMGDLAFLPEQRRFAMVMNRFRWEGPARSGKRRRPKTGERVRAGLHFDGVLKADVRNLALNVKGQVIELLAIRHEDDGEDGVILLEFAGNASIRLSVECIEAHLTDLSDPWPASRMPAHVLD